MDYVRGDGVKVNENFSFMERKGDKRNVSKTIEVGQMGGRNSGSQLEGLEKENE
jgi:hypothetical protein